nr:immunoglobulin light chain junction region [Macaca mulatta]
DYHCLIWYDNAGLF